MSTISKTAFDLVHPLWSYNHLVNFGILPKISSEGWNFESRPSPLDSARKLESNGANFGNLGWIWKFSILKKHLPGKVGSKGSSRHKNFFCWNFACWKPTNWSWRRSIFLSGTLPPWYWSVVSKISGCVFQMKELANCQVQKSCREGIKWGVQRWRLHSIWFTQWNVMANQRNLAFCQLSHHWGRISHYDLHRWTQHVNCNRLVSLRWKSEEVGSTWPLGTEGFQKLALKCLHTLDLKPPHLKQPHPG